MVGRSRFLSWFENFIKLVSSEAKLKADYYITIQCEKIKVCVGDDVR